jgi:neutral ceramidase
VSRDGRPISLLANYSLHYVGGFPDLSADYFGVFAERMTKLLGAEKVQPAFVGIMSNGTSGDVNNINVAAPDKARRPAGEQISIVADSVAETAHDAFKTIKYLDWVPLAVEVREIELGVRRPSPEEVTQARNVLSRAKGQVLTDPKEVYARETVKLADYPPTVKANLQAIRIGDLGIVSSPCETFVETGLEIKKHSPLKTTFIIELANGYNGYLPTPEQHALGGYETWRARSSYLEKNASRKITNTLLELLASVAK